MGDYGDYNDDKNELDQSEEIFDEYHDNTDMVIKGMSNKKILSYCGLYLSIMTIAVFATQLIVSFIAGMLFPDGSESGWFNVVLTVVGIVGVGLPVFYKLMKKIPDSEIGEQKKLSSGKFIGYFIVCVALAYISNIVGLFISAFIELIKGIEVINPLEDFLFNSNMVLVMIYAIIIAPIVEELIFRKILLDKLRRFGDLPAILITGFAFGIFHFNLPQFFYATVLGILFAYITIRTNRIIYAIVLHMLMNLMGAGIVPLVTASQNPLGLGLVTIWFFGTMTIGSILLILNGKKVLLIKPIEPLVRKRDYILNPGTLLFLIIGISVILFGLII
ncbi:MAG: CPBP family intramembrane metalloprotease [Anaerolineaceae bacterium]|nr:MAG: CPBP family intramembrane metalloprotease [Anaerolineaceae bacterium]